MPTMTFYGERNEPILHEVLRVHAHVTKHADGWHSFLAILLGKEYVALDGSHYYRERLEGLGTRKEALQVVRAWLLDHFGSVPAGATLSIERAPEMPFPVALNPARPFSREATHAK